MFDSLSEIIVPTVDPAVTAPVFSAETALESLIAADMEIENELDFSPAQELTDLRLAVETIDQLIAFRDSVVKFGLTQSLMTFADYTGVLSASIPEIPALETMTDDLSIEASQDIVVALEAMIGDRIKVFLKTFAARVANFFNHFRRNKEHLHKYLVRMHVLSEMLAEGRGFDQEKANAKMFFGHDYDRLVHLMESTHQVVDAMKRVGDPNLPVTFEAFETWHEKLRAALKPVVEITHIDIASTGTLVKLKDDTRTRKSMHAHGYDSVDKFHKLLALLPDVLKAMSDICDMDNEILNIHSDTYTIDEHGNVRESYALRYLAKACELVMEITWNIARSVYDIGTEAHDAMKAIFYCTDKKTKTEAA